MPSKSTCGDGAERDARARRGRPARSGDVALERRVEGRRGPDRPASRMSVNAERSSSVSVTVTDRRRSSRSIGSGTGTVRPARTVSRRPPRGSRHRRPGNGTTISSPSASGADERVGVERGVGVADLPAGRAGRRGSARRPGRAGRPRRPGARRAGVSVAGSGSVRRQQVADLALAAAPSGTSSVGDLDPVVATRRPSPQPTRSAIARAGAGHAAGDRERLLQHLVHEEEGVAGVGDRAGRRRSAPSRRCSTDARIGTRPGRTPAR